MSEVTIRAIALICLLGWTIPLALGRAIATVIKAVKGTDNYMRDEREADQNEHETGEI